MLFQADLLDDIRNLHLGDVANTRFKRTLQSGLSLGRKLGSGP